MNYKDYIESIYHIVKSLEYLQGDLKTNVQTQLLEVLEQAYQETGVPSFKIFLEFKRAFPESTYCYDSKTCITKNKTRIKLSKTYTQQENCPFHINQNDVFRLDNNEERFGFKGKVLIERRVYGRVFNADFSLGDHLYIDFVGLKNYNEEEMTELIQHIRTIRQ